MPQHRSGSPPRAREPKGRAGPRPRSQSRENPGLHEPHNPRARPSTDPHVGWPVSRRPCRGVSARCQRCLCIIPEPAAPEDHGQARALDRPRGDAGHGSLDRRVVAAALGRLPRRSPRAEAVRGAGPGYFGCLPLHDRARSDVYDPRGPPDDGWNRQRRVSSARSLHGHEHRHGAGERRPAVFLLVRGRDWVRGGALDRRWVGRPGRARRTLDGDDSRPDRGSSHLRAAPGQRRPSRRRAATLALERAQDAQRSPGSPCSG